MATYYVATPGGGGNDGNPGTLASPWATWQKGFSELAAGDTLYIRGGTYASGSGTTRTMWDGTYYCGATISYVNGSVGSIITVENYPGETPILDCSTLNKAQFNAGIIIYDCDYWHLKGLSVCEVEGSSQGCLGIVGVSINNCTFELLKSYDNGGSGILIEYASDDNLILNCDSYNNYDTLGGGYNADGIEVSYIYVSTPRRTNTIQGCRSWNNSDDGYDYYANEGYIIVDKCYAWHNGFNKGGSTVTGDGNGFKLGSQFETPIADQITVTNCVSFHNASGGFTMESDVGGTASLHIFYNNIAYHNGDGDQSWNWQAGFQGWSAHNVGQILRNNISYANADGNTSQFGTNYVQSNNSWSGYTVTDADFASLDQTGVDGTREADDYPPILTFLHLVGIGSDLYRTGTDVSLSEDCDRVAWANPPSLGAFEYYEVPPQVDVPVANAELCKFSIL